MRKIRARFRLFLFFILTLGTYLLRMMGKPLGYLSTRADMRWRQKVFQGWSRCVSRLIGMKINVVGQPPRPPFFLVTNHLSYVDIALLSGLLDGVFVAKSDVRGWPFLGPITNVFDTIYIDRNRNSDILLANQLIEKALARGEGVTLFAEGTSSRGDKVYPIKSSLLSYPAERSFPVSYASISYRCPDGEPPAGTHICWWGDMEFVSHFLDMLEIPRFQATVTFGTEAIVDQDRKRLAEKIQQAISRIFTPVVN